MSLKAKKIEIKFKQIKKIAFFFVLLLFASNVAKGNDVYSKADSIISNVLRNREFYCNFVEEYDATVYLKGNNYVHKKNFLYRYAPNFLYLDRKGESNFVESVLDVHFQAPNHFDQDIVAVNGSKLNTSDIQERVMPFLNFNIYSPTLFNNQVLLPGEKDIFRYYRFEYISEMDTLNHTIHKIAVRPKVRSQQLISGDFYIVDKKWTVFRLDVRGKWEFSRYTVEAEFGLPDTKYYLLPLKTKITFKLSLLGNEVVNHYFSSYEYSSIKKSVKNKKRMEDDYDLTDYYSLKDDLIPIIDNEEFWEAMRPVPLTEYEKELIEKKKKKENTEEIDSTKIDQPDYFNLVKGTIIPRKIQYNNSQFSYSGLVNPLKLSYSRRDGIVYWQQIRFSTNFENDKRLSFNPNVGFLFKKKEIYFRTPISWLFQPSRFGELNFNFGNKNQTYNYKTENLINEEIPDSLDFEDLDLEYYRHLNILLSGQYELTNGLILYGGLDYSWYTPVKSKDGNDLTAQLRGNTEEDIQDIIDDKYRTFSSIAGLTWTPGQYYRYNGKRKEYVGSRYPTFSLEYSRGIKGIGDSNSDFERIEIDVQQKIPLGLMRSFQYYVGIGQFTNTKSFYFADFSLFQKRNIPESWDDPIGGVFHLLEGKWYNASDSYAQGHFMYEAPFIILQLFRGVNKDILKERFYISQLYTPALPSYTEFGYGVGNFIGNAGIFVSMKKGKLDSVGMKFSFELGR